MFDFGEHNEFDWDPQKNQTNIEKHGISFVAAARAFRDEQGVVNRSDREHAAEERFLLVGDPGDGLIAVVFTIRGELIRIISARKASRHERIRYREGASAS